ncbi:MAG TPA: class I SAM-dependent methyltransferase [Bryobacteraceae bacterium]|nr:class I SAM-dependent methyltransferase [Bryobacteraceae bacterium]
MRAQLARTGPIYDIAHPLLESRGEYQSFVQGGARDEFSAFLDVIAPELIAVGLPPEDVHFAKRYPPSAKLFVRAALQTLVSRGLLPHANYDEEGYDAVATEMERYYEHGPFRTYIYPEEARLLFAIVDIVRPKSVVFLGSYYGYWAHAALSAVARHGGRAVLIDPDPKAQEVAFRNLEQAGLLEIVNVAVTTGQEYLKQTTEIFDLVVLDAETPRDYPDPEQRGKAIYAPLLRQALPRMTPDALLVCHNILFTNLTDCAFLDGVIARNHHELGAFLELVRREFTGLVECTSTEGIGVARRRTHEN